MGELGGGVLAIWLLSRLARALLKRVPNIEERSVVLLSVAGALALAVSIAQSSMGSEAEQFGYSPWGYALLVYTPGAIFWAIFDLYRLSRRHSDADPQAAALRLYEELRAEGHPVPDSPFREDGLVMTPEEIGNATQQALTLRLYRKLKDGGLLVPDSPYDEDGSTKSILEISRELGDRSVAALTSSDNPPTDQHALEEFVRSETARFRSDRERESGTGRDFLYRRFVCTRPGYEDPERVDHVLALANRFAKNINNNDSCIRFYHVLVGIMMYEHPKGGSGLVDENSSLPALALIKMMNAAQFLEDTDL